MRRYRLLSIVLSMALLLLFNAMPQQHARAEETPKYYIEVDVGNQIVTIYDAASMSIVRQMLCSSGEKINWTPLGEYIMPENEKRTDRDPWYQIGGLYVRYATRIYGSVLFHSIPYTCKSLNCIDPECLRRFGTPASHGCVRLRWQDARFIAENCPAGTRVKILQSETRDDELRALLYQETFDASKGFSYESFLGNSPDPNVLDRKCRGQKVLDLQYRLRDLGVYDGEMSGVYDSATVNAVRFAQYLLGGDATGLADPAFLQAIYDENAPTAMNVSLETGMSGPAVRQLQANLQALRLYVESLDSVYDASVVEAVKRFQRAYCYEEDGVASPTVQKAIAYEAGRLAEAFGDSDYSCSWADDPIVLVKVNVKDAIRLRDKPSLKGQQLRKLPAGRRMVVVEGGKEWSRVRVGADEGYVRNDMVALSGRAVSLLKYVSATDDLVCTVGNDARDYLAGAELPCEVFEAYLDANDQQVDVSSLGSFVTVNTGEGDVALNMRQAPDGDSAVLTTVENGSNLRALRRTSDWTLVSYHGQSGYLMNRYLTFWTGPSDALEAQASAEAAQSDTTGYAVVISATDRKAPVYQEDSEDARILGHLPDGTLLQVVGAMDGWCRISYKGHEGYMIGEDLMMDATQQVSSGIGPT